MSNNVYEVNNNHHEITLVDLVKILVKKKILLLSVFAVCSVMTISYAFLMNQNYQYTSIYQLAETAPGVALETSQSLIAKTNNVYLNSLINEYLEEKDLESMPFETELNSPNNTLLFRLITKSQDDERDSIASFHESILQEVTQGQAEQLQRRQNILEKRLESIQQSIESLSESNNPMTAELMARYTIQASEIQENLVNLIPGEVTHIAAKSVEPVGPSRFFVLAVGGILSVLLAVGVTLLASFISVVKNSLENEE